MLANFLKKTTLLNYVWISLLAVFYAFLILPDNGDQNLWIFCSYLSMVSLVVYLDEKLNLSKESNLVVLFFLCFITLIPQWQFNLYLIPSLLAILLVFGNSIGDKSNRQTFFNMGFYLAVSTFFIPETVIFSFYILWVLIQRGGSYLLHLFCTLLSALTFYFLVFTFYYWRGEVEVFYALFSLDIRLLSFENFSFRIVLILSLLAFVIIHGLSLRTQNEVGVRLSNVYLLMFLTLLLCLVCADKVWGLLLFFALPWSIFLANYLDWIRSDWLKDTVFFMFILLPLITYYL